MNGTENSGISKSTRAFGLSLALACVVNGLLVVAKERIPAVMAGMQKLSGHHWVTHGIAVLAVFGVGGLLFGWLNGGQGPKTSAGKLIGTVVMGALLGGGIIVGFYLVGG